MSARQPPRAQPSVAALRPCRHAGGVDGGDDVQNMLTGFQLRIRIHKNARNHTDSCIALFVAGSYVHLRVHLNSCN